jgi:hypothetical protein
MGDIDGNHWFKIKNLCLWDKVGDTNE